MQYLIANWKAEMTFKEVKVWCFTFMDLINDEVFNEDNKPIKIILAPSFPYLRFVSQTFEMVDEILVASQDVSPYTSGKYTGEVTANMVADFASYSIVGHSERRKHLHETEEQISLKIEQLHKQSIQPILCIRNENDKLHTADIIAFEPVAAIGSGQNMSPDQVLKFMHKLPLEDNHSFLYGGSVDPSNVDEYLQTNQIDGFLVGTSSLDPNEFFEIAQKIVSYL